MVQTTPQFKMRFPPAKMSIAGYIEPEDRKSATLILDTQVGEVEGSAIKSTSIALL